MNRTDTVVYPYNGYFSANKSKQTTKTCTNIDESQVHYDKCKRTDSKGHILFCFYDIQENKTTGKENRYFLMTGGRRKG